jgi:YfiH family protein
VNADRFSRKEVNGITFYSSDLLERLPGVRHGFSTRRGIAGDEPTDRFNLGRVAWAADASIAENRRQFLAALKLQGASLATLAQSHSDKVLIIEENAGDWNDPPEGDALATRSVGTALAVLAADCWPILIADPGTGAVAAVHAGWRGTLARLPAKAIARMARSFGSDPGRLLIAIGPGIRGCCYEVGSELAGCFNREFPGVICAQAESGRKDKYLLDLRPPIDSQLREAGIEPANVSDLNVCTRCLPSEFFSYRREGSLSGRQMGLIARV